MADFRSYAPHADASDAEITLTPEESHHLIRVNRARAGDPVVAFNGRGDEWVCECFDADRRGARLRVVTHRKWPPSTVRIALAQALPKGKTFEAIIRKATELGVASIRPLVTARTEVRLDEARQEVKRQKWVATAVEAAKQSGNPFLPEIAPVQSIEDFLQTARDFDLRLVASLQENARPLRRVLEETEKPGPEQSRTAIWLVGPEGDLTAAEYAAAEAAGFEPVTLGPLVLRCDTAALYAASILHYELHL